MDNTRAIAPNERPYIMAEKKMFENKTNLANSIPKYPIHSRSGAQVFMDTRSIFTATNMHFLPPTRTKSSNDIDLSRISSMGALKEQTVHTSTVESATFSLHKTLFVAAAAAAAVTTTATTNTKSQVLPEKFRYSASLTEYNNGNHQISDHHQHHHSEMSPGNCKFYGDNSSHKHATTDGNRTFVNTFKSFVHSLFKPIMDAVGSENNQTKSMTATSTNRKPTPSPPPHTYCDKENCTDSFCHSIDNKQSANTVYSNRELFFDCDDYIDGGEDTIDFVADSTKFVSHSFGDEFSTAMTANNIQPVAKDSIYYDCINKTDTFGMAVATAPLSPTITQPSTAPTSCESAIRSESIDNQMENTDCNVINVNKLGLNDAMSACNMQSSDDTVQYYGGGGVDRPSAVMNSAPKFEKSIRTAHRRKHRAKRKNKSSKYWRKGCAPNKNRHEKQRHEIEMNLHDDLETCSIFHISLDQDDDIDLEIIDLDDDDDNGRSPKSSPSAKSITTVTQPISNTNACIETPIPSPEVITDGCIFTRFFPFTASNCAVKSHPMSPLRFFKKFQVPAPGVSRPPFNECRPVAMRRVSESESDDNFIVFEDISPRPTCSLDTYQRQRPHQVSECSDDFILFEDGTEDACLRYDTTDEDFYLTDSTDDTDSSSDDGKLCVCVCASFFDCSLSLTHSHSNLYITSFFEKAVPLLCFYNRIDLIVALFFIGNFYRIW